MIYAACPEIRREPRLTCPDLIGKIQAHSAPKIPTLSESITQHPHRPLAPFLGLTPLSYPRSPKSFPLNSFADPHPLNLYATIFCKNGGGGGGALDVPAFQLSDVRTFSIPLSPLTATLMDPPQVLQTKDLRHRLSLLDATLTKNRGWGPGRSTFRPSTFKRSDDLLALHYPLHLGECRMPTREDAWKLLCEYTASESFRKHMLAVEAWRRAYARKFRADVDRFAVAPDGETWGLAALLRDFD